MAASPGPLRGTPVQIIGSYLSPYVRKVLVCLDWKGIAYEIDPIIPFMGDERFSQLSPAAADPGASRRRVTLADSSVICQYLEDAQPEPAFYPRDVADRARARWLEEFADTRMGDVFIWRLFNQVAINPRVWGEPTDEAVLKQTLEDDVPDVLDYLETQLPATGFLFGAALDRGRLDRLLLPQRRVRALQRRRRPLAEDGRLRRARARAAGLPAARALREQDDPHADRRSTATR